MTSNFPKFSPNLQDIMYYKVKIPRKFIQMLQLHLSNVKYIQFTYILSKHLNLPKNRFRNPTGNTGHMGFVYQQLRATIL